MGFIARQPNGLLCRYSDVTDCVSDYNMTDEDYISLCMERAKAEAMDVLKNSVRPFLDIEVSFMENNMIKEEFKEILEEMQRPKEFCHWKDALNVAEVKEQEA